MWRGWLFVGFLAASTQAFHPALIRWSGRFDKNSYLVSTVSLDGIATSQQVTLRQTSGPYFTTKQDNTISCDANNMRWCLEASGTEHGHVVLVNHCTGTPTQKWWWLPGGPIQLQGTNQCIYVNDNDGLTRAPAELRECADKIADTWTFEYTTPSPAWSSLQSPSSIFHIGVVVMAAALSLGIWLSRWQTETRGAFASNSSVLLNMGQPRVCLTEPMAMRLGGVPSSATSNLRGDNDDRGSPCRLIRNKITMKIPSPEVQQSNDAGSAKIDPRRAKGSAADRIGKGSGGAATVPKGKGSRGSTRVPKGKGSGGKWRKNIQCQESDGNDYHENAVDTTDGDDKFLRPFKSKWRDLVELEWREELRIVEDRLNNWSMDRLVRQGLCITDMSARKRGQFFGKAKITFSKDTLSRHNFTPGDEVIVSRKHPLHDRCAWKGELIELGASRITVVSDSVPYDIRTGYWRLDCGPNKTAYERTKSALGYITGTNFKQKALRRLLFDENSSEMKPLNEVGDLDMAEASVALNETQLDAIQHVGNETLGLIQGPPGTGKTTTTCHLIRALVNRSGSNECSVLASADSNVAVDQLLEGLVKLGVNALRVGFPSKVTEGLREYTLLAKMEKHPLASKIEELRVSLQRVKDDVNGGKLKGKGKGLAYRDISLYVRDIQQMEQEMTAELIASADVVCSTLIGCGSDALMQCRFPTVVIDEATQATEPRCLVALQKCQNQVILIGDQQQLPPVVVCAEAERKGLKHSLFDRLLNSSLFDGHIRMLKMQYRMHPLIRKWPSMQFYKDELLDGPDCIGEGVVTGFPQPVAYIDTSTGIGTTLLKTAYIPCSADCANQERQNSVGSKYNLHEVELVRWCVDKLLRLLRAEDIGVISPYTAQINEIKRVFEKSAGKYHGVEVKTVDGFQGREKSAIVFSCVRTSGLGFLTDYRRLNVGITRAKRQLVVIGFGDLLRQDSTWSSYLDFLDQEGLLLQQ